ncbi:unnamed protein product [Haemonchus placei]|uniref:Coat protein n=1 Tax=Haemonchus placei TaxID=6290 RepID=A0A0N4W4X0_HAEPC|nr:unnamed protein product [Haemonchus placei]
MDDLLSVALSEAGLEEFLTATPPPSESLAVSTTGNSTDEATPSPSTSSLTAKTTISSASESREEGEENILLDGAPDGTFPSDNHVELSQPSTSAVSPAAFASEVNVVREEPVNVPTRQVTTFKQGPTTTAPKQIRQVYTASPTGGQLFRQVVQTPDGPRTQLLRPFINVTVGFIVEIRS